jgi:hypothetical protein
MLQRFGRSIKIAFVMLKLYKLGYMPRDAILLIGIAGVTCVSGVVSTPPENRSTSMYVLVLYLAVLFSTAMICSVCGKIYLYSKVHSDVVYLTSTVGPILTGMLSGTRKFSDVNNWLHSHIFPQEAQIERINFAALTLRQVSDAIGLEHTLGWFISANVGPEEISPAEAIRADRFDEVRVSATRIMEDQWS